MRAKTTSARHMRNGMEWSGVEWRAEGRGQEAEAEAEAEGTYEAFARAGQQ